MRKYVAIFFLVLASASSAQPPLIDSMLVDEDKSDLYIYGDFGAVQGKVWVDSVEMNVRNWTDSVI
jgi:hypothetical protein